MTWALYDADQIMEVVNVICMHTNNGACEWGWQVKSLRKSTDDCIYVAMLIQTKFEETILGRD